MGTFKIEIVAVGGHGVDRGKKDGEKVNFNADGAFSPGNYIRVGTSRKNK